jgi:glucosamine--fructose-6-phosphate aminotransferase (isomerizing)
MCGIVAYLGPRQAYPILIKGLHRLEYRGYDSAGICLLNGGLKAWKCKGKVSDLEQYVEGNDLDGTVGMAHTRWATHGEPNQINAHPHFSQSGNLSIIHNGIIENYLVLRQELKLRGYEFTSDTDTEVLAHLIEDIKKNENVPVEEAVRVALTQVIGAYAIVVLCQDHPHKIIAARKGSPMVIGLGKDEFFVASDATPIIEYTDNVVYMNDEEIAVIERGSELKMKTTRNQERTPYIQKLEMSLSAIEKGGFPHFMLKEIFEQPHSIMDSLRGRLHLDQDTVTLGGIRDYLPKILNAQRIIITACGTSWHAGLVGEYIIEDLARIPVEVEYSSEFRYRNPVINEKDVIIAISQSGETADTLAAIELAKSKGATVLGICNVVGSSIARATHAGVYTHAGPEIGVASTKAFTAQVVVLTLMGLLLAEKKGTVPESVLHKLRLELGLIPSKVERILKNSSGIEDIAGIYKDRTNALYLGRGYYFPVALEGALKLKEISYIHAEGYPAAEMKHGPIALIDERMPVVFIAPKRGIYEKVISNIEEVRARKGNIIAIITEGDESIKRLAEHFVEIPDTEEMFIPLLATIPLQLLSYYVAVMRGCNVDQPRNLAKSVTVE